MSALFTLPGQLRVVGAVLVALGLAHAVLPRGLAWPREFRRLRPLTRQIMYTHTFFIGVVCVLAGLPALLLPRELLAGGRLAAGVLAGQCAFWALRWCAQFVAFPPSLWRASRRYTVGHLGFALLWTWVVAVFATALAAAWRA